MDAGGPLTVGQMVRRNQRAKTKAGGAKLGAAAKSHKVAKKLVNKELAAEGSPEASFLDTDMGEIVKDAGIHAGIGWFMDGKLNVVGELTYNGANAVYVLMLRDTVHNTLGGFIDLTDETMSEIADAAAKTLLVSGVETLAVRFLMKGDGKKPSFMDFLIRTGLTEGLSKVTEMILAT